MRVHDTIYITIQFILRQKCIIIAAADKFDTGKYVLEERNVKAA